MYRHVALGHNHLVQIHEEGPLSPPVVLRSACEPRNLRSPQRVRERLEVER